MKILICDDHKIVREGLRQILLQLNTISLITEAGNGNEALYLLKTEVFDIVLPVWPIQFRKAKNEINKVIIFIGLFVLGIHFEWFVPSFFFLLKTLPDMFHQ